jgi:hypothetical protein
VQPQHIHHFVPDQHRGKAEMLLVCQQQEIKGGKYCYFAIIYPQQPCCENKDAQFQQEHDKTQNSTGIGRSFHDFIILLSIFLAQIS